MSWKATVLVINRERHLICKFLFPLLSLIWSVKLKGIVDDPILFSMPYSGQETLFLTEMACCSGKGRDDICHEANSIIAYYKTCLDQNLFKTRMELRPPIALLLVSLVHRSKAIEICSSGHPEEAPPGVISSWLRSELGWMDHHRAQLVVTNDLSWDDREQVKGPEHNLSWVPF